MPGGGGAFSHARTATAQCRLFQRRISAALFGAVRGRCSATVRVYKWSHVGLLRNFERK